MDGAPPSLYQKNEVLMDNVEPNEARKIQKHYVCSDCYEDLQVWYNGKTKTSRVQCQTPGCPCNGFVKRGTVERMEQKSMGELMDATITLTRAGVIQPPAPRDPKDVLKELGF